jgi:uncharacterized membrane protein
MPTELMVLKFTTPMGASNMLDVLKEVQAQDFIELLDAVIVTKDANQKVQVYQPLAVSPGRGAAFGALTGAVVGLLGGPAGVIVGLVSGAVTGGATAAVWEAGLPEDDVRTLAADELQPGDSALLVYFDEVWIDQIEQAVRDFDDSITRRVIQAQRKAEREEAAEVRKEKIDAAYKSWQATLDQQRTNLVALRDQMHTNVQSNREAIQKQIEAANAKLNQTYHNVLHTLQVWQQQLEANIRQLETQAKQATAQTKADADQRLASAKQSQQALRSDVKATLTARLNHLKAEIESLKTQATNARGEAKDKLNQRITKLQADWDAEQKRLDQLDAAYGEAYDTMVTSIDQAIVTYEAAADEAEAEYAKAAYA